MRVWTNQFKMEVSTEWLKQRAEEEVRNIQSKSISRLSFMFTSKEKIKQNEIDAAKSLAKVEMIKEIFERVAKQNGA